MLPSHCYERNRHKSEAALVRKKAVERTKWQLRAIRGLAAARPGRVAECGARSTFVTPTGQPHLSASNKLNVNFNFTFNITAREATG
jgi:hypothetical protein